MNTNLPKGKFRELRGAFLQSWGRLTHRYSYVLRGTLDKAVGKIQSFFGRF
ncbi:CsbD family protein [Desulfomonile tiedjei]|uniref:CsbD family protein n=1 Tax=Desulfomonile tiedjei (strain ATCC 49306 / DSM 6799 / DCB-1) TaxID=706587 RepID=I4C0E4_DESTA|nr:hypothetical protein [Desulfomonile tiedjei]AFM23035.1 hypothetical protein Desti_0294 [Desulfomonile tiedjei DSM 6799]